jgi:hypothetical protein
VHVPHTSDASNDDACSPSLRVPVFSAGSALYS